MGLLCGTRREAMLASHVIQKHRLAEPLFRARGVVTVLALIVAAFVAGLKQHRIV